MRWEVARLEREERKIQGEGERIRKAQDQEMSKTDNEELEENDKKQQVEHKLELGFGERGKPFLVSLDTSHLCSFHIAFASQTPVPENVSVDIDIAFIPPTLLHESHHNSNILSSRI